MRLRSAWLCLGPALALCLTTQAPAYAQDAGTTVQKTPLPTGGGPQNALKPSQDVGSPDDSVDPGDGSAAPGDIDSKATDEGSGWDAAVEEAKGATPLIGDQQAAAVERINAYFNGITTLQGNFDQVDSNNKHTTGRFYVQRPGKIRFDYAPPSTIRIVSDGHFLAIEDSDLKTIEKYPIESTPFRLLLGEGVDLGRDAKVVGVDGDDTSLAITVVDKGGEANGQIRLYFDTKPDLTLKQWVIVDAQGLSTTVTVNNLAPGRKVAADFFNATVSFQPFR